MTDKELLELAAKAAGEWPSPEPFEHVMNRWNPLTDDGDALRLAVKLEMDLWLGDGGATAEQGKRISETQVVDPEHDPYAATRRAIVRAAAEIGKGMK